MILKSINLEISPGEILTVLGKVGSGKSALLLAMMHELELLRGEVKKNGRIAFIS